MTRLKVQPLALGPTRNAASTVLTAFLPLGCLMAYAKVHEGGVLRDRFDFRPVTPIRGSLVQQILDEATQDAPGIYLFSSYVWNHALNVQIARQIRQRSRDSLILLGGPHIPRQEILARRFMNTHPMFDVIARHEGEITFAEILQALVHGNNVEGLRRTDLSQVDGISFRRDKGRIVRTPDRQRSKDLGRFPSPYLSGEFDHWADSMVYMPVESNRGCPYGCTFCDWGAATLSKVYTMSMDRILGEVDYAAKHQVEVLGFCDANFGILPRDLEIVEHIIATHEAHGYPKNVGYTNAKVAKPRLLQICKRLRDAGLISAAQISMQTTDEHVLENVARSNIKTEEYEKMITYFHSEGIPVASDMMIGLPGQSLDVVKKDLQFFFDRKVQAVIFSTILMPNAPMASEEYRQRFDIVASPEGFVEATSSFTREEFGEMFELCLAYKLLVKSAVAKYLLYFMQLERGVRAMDFVARWGRRGAADDDAYPITSQVKRLLLDRDYRDRARDLLTLHWNDEEGALLLERLDEFYAETLRMYRTEFGASIDGSDVRAVIELQRAALPRKGRSFPCSIEVEHDVVAYFGEVSRAASVASLPEAIAPLSARGPGLIELPSQPERTSYAFLDSDYTAGTLEVRSPVRV